jgi:hypothetical protein
LLCDIIGTQAVLRSGLEALVAAEPEITRYDNLIGDGDCGITLKRGVTGQKPKLLIIIINFKPSTDAGFMS